jgi:hypothetical protein
MEYTSAFTAGPLMPKRSAQIVAEINRGTSPDEIDPSIVDINSWEGQRRKVGEIKRRLESADESVWEDGREYYPARGAVVDENGNLVGD